MLFGGQHELCFNFFSFQPSECSFPFSFHDSLQCLLPTYSCWRNWLWFSYFEILHYGQLVIKDLHLVSLSPFLYAIDSIRFVWILYDLSLLPDFASMATSLSPPNIVILIMYSPVNSTGGLINQAFRLNDQAQSLLALRGTLKKLMQLCLRTNKRFLNTKPSSSPNDTKQVL